VNTLELFGRKIKRQALSASCASPADLSHRGRALREEASLQSESWSCRDRLRFPQLQVYVVPGRGSRRCRGPSGRTGEHSRWPRHSVPVKGTPGRDWRTGSIHLSGIDDL